MHVRANSINLNWRSPFWPWSTSQAVSTARERAPAWQAAHQQPQAGPTPAQTAQPRRICRQPRLHRDGPRIRRGPTASSGPAGICPLFSPGHRQLGPHRHHLPCASSPFHAESGQRRRKSPSPAVLFTSVVDGRADATPPRLSALPPPPAGAIHAMTPPLWPAPSQPPPGTTVRGLSRLLRQNGGANANRDRAMTVTLA